MSEPIAKKQKISNIFSIEIKKEMPKSSSENKEESTTKDGSNKEVDNKNNNDHDKSKEIVSKENDQEKSTVENNDDENNDQDEQDKLPSEEEILNSEDSFEFSKLLSKIKEKIEQLSNLKQNEEIDSIDEKEESQLMTLIDACIRKSEKKTAIAWSKPPVKILIKLANEKRIIFNDQNKLTIAEYVKRVNRAVVTKLDKEVGGKSFQAHADRWRGADIANPRNKG